jgi:adenylosuccinate lyase
MIDRYEIPEISSLWTDEARFKAYLQVEVAHLQTLEEEAVVPKGLAKKFTQAKIDLKRIAEIEKTTNHDVIAFCMSITEQFSPEESRYFHFGLTSSDVIDTATSLLIRDSILVIKSDLEALASALLEQATETSDLLCIGRSHGIHAEAMIFGQKFLSFLAELKRRQKDWDHCIGELTGQLSGAVGNYTILTPEQEEKTLKRLDLKVEPVSTQVIARDHHALLISVGGLIGVLLERMAVEFRLLQHSDVDEVREGFSQGQKGSSTMPHKKNPISSENITGMARLLRSHISPSMENCVLWHERDISHSSVERMIFPDHFGILSYSLRRMRAVVQNLVIDREKIESKVRTNEKIYSSYILHKLIEKNPETPRESIYEIVQTGFFSSKNKDELKTKLESLLTKEKLNHDVKSWLDLETLRSLYRGHFVKVLKRLP